MSFTSFVCVLPRHWVAAGAMVMTHGLLAQSESDRLGDGQPPLFVGGPESVKVLPASSVSLTAAASGTLPIAYQWQKGTNRIFANLVDSGDLEGSMGAVLKLAGVTMSDNAEFRLIASNAAGMATSSVAVVTVISPLTAVTAPGDAIVSFGGNMPEAEGVGCMIDGSTAKCLILGANGGAPFAGSVGFMTIPGMGRTVVSALRFYTANDAEERDPANFALEGSNDGGDSFTTIASGPLELPSSRNAGGAELNPMTRAMQQVVFRNTAGYTLYRVSFADTKGRARAVGVQIGEVEILGEADDPGQPAVRSQPVSVSVVVGGRAEFRVKATGVPAPAYQWLRARDGVYVAMTDGAGVVGSREAMLRICHVGAKDAGDYRVVVSNSSGVSQSMPASLIVVDQMGHGSSTAGVVSGRGLR